MAVSKEDPLALESIPYGVTSPPPAPLSATGGRPVSSAANGAPSRRIKRRTTEMQPLPTPGGSRQKQGHHTFAYPDGTLYDGEWLNDEQHGSGTCVYPSGNIYVGEWACGQCEGKGVMLYADSDMFEGQWKNGVCDGEGVFYSGGTETVGVWSKGEKIEGKVVDYTHDTEPGGGKANALLRQRTVAAMIRSTTACLFPSSLTHSFASTPERKGDPVPYASPTSNLGGRPHRTPPQLPLDHSSKQQPEGTRLTRRTALGFSMLEQPDLAASTVVTVNEDAGVVKPTGGPSGAGGSERGGSSLLLAVAGPSYNTTFNLMRWFKYFSLFMFPFLSLPHCRCPLRVNVLDLEREYVVSGAALHIDFEQPTTALYCSALAVCSAVLVLMAEVASLQNEYRSTSHTPVSLIDIVLPLVGCVLFAAMNAGYHSYGRVAHALERVDRKTFPKLASFAANCVDSQARVCIYTWGEDGNSKVTNAHYRYRWLAVSIVFGILVAFLSPIYRAANAGGPLFGHSPSEQAVMVTSFLGAFFSVAGITFYVMKCIDMERQVLAQLKILSRTAYLEGVCLLRPTDHRKMKFNLDAPLSLVSFNEGFVGWYVTRCFVLYASTCSNHQSRTTSMSVFFLFLLFVCAVTYGDLIVGVEGGFTTEGKENLHYSAAQLIGLLFVLVWGLLLLRYMYLLISISAEKRKHVYIVDVAAMYHGAKVGGGHEGGNYGHSHGGNHRHSSSWHANLVPLCKAMMSEHDQRPTMVGIPVSSHLFFATFIVLAGAASALAYWFVMGGTRKYGGGRP